LTSDGTYNYQYDPEGNRQSRTNIVTQAVDEYTWDYRNRLTGIVSKDSGGAVIKTVGYTYDVDDQRMSKTVTTGTGSTTEKYYLDGNQIAFVTDGGGNQMFHYLYGLNVDQVLAQDSPAGMVWALADRLGSIETITDGEGVVVDKRTFDSFGRVLSETNPSVSFRYGYTGRELDLESGLDYYRARYYDPQVGRFISVDPMGFGAGDTNLYRYVGNSSTNATDPTGLYSFDDFGRDAYGGLENTDRFVAGFADRLTGGRSTQLRNDLYGDIVAGQHEGAAFSLGQSVGLATGLVTIGVATGGAGIVAGGLDTGFQLWQNQGDFSKIDLTSVAISAVSGRIGAGVSAGLGKGGALVAGGAFAKTGLGLGARTAINAGVGFNLGYWGKVTENAFKGEELTNGAWQSGAFGGIGAGAGELLSAGAGAATSKIKDFRLDYALKPLRKEFGTNVNWGFEGNNITLKEAKSLVKNIGQNPVSNSLLREVNSSTGGYKLNVNFNTKTTKEIGKVIKLGDEAGDLFGMISYQSQNSLVKSTKPIDISIYWDAIKNKSAGVLDPVHFATSKVSHELTHATDIFRTGRRVNHLSDEWMAYQNEKLSLNYYEGLSSLKNEDYGHIARQVGVYRNLPTYVDDLGEALDEMF
jgi:RHS repeat-associated protein